MKTESTSKSCAFVTLGCKVNQYDTQAIREGLRAHGYEDVAPDEAADVYVVNTCTVTGQSGAKSRKEIRKLVRRNPNAQVVVTGCYVESDRALLEAMDGVSVVAGNAEKFRIPWMVSGEDAIGADDDFGSIARFEGHTRAFMKVEDGCDLECTYCIIPAVRGDVRSKPVADAVAEAHRLVEAGHKEIVLTGIHLGAYGADRDGEGLPGLLQALERVDGLARIRLSSLEVNEVSAELLAVMAASEKVCPHLHLPLQSGSDAVLKRMRRPYGIKKFRDSVESIRMQLDRPTFTTDVITGFPGETDVQFQQTVAVSREMGFIKIHVFPYSRREGTPAARMKETVSAQAIDERTQRLLEVSDEIGFEHRKELVGSEVEVLLEGDEKSGSEMAFSGLTRRYERVALDNATPKMVNRMVRVRVMRAEPRLLFGSTT